MRRNRSTAGLTKPAWTLVLPLLGMMALPTTARAQKQLGPGMPLPRVFIVTPCGGRAGSTVEVTVTGQDLEDPQGLFFSQPGITAEVLPAAPPLKAGPKMAAPPKNNPPLLSAKFKVTIPPDTPPGIHDVRLINRLGVSNPRAFVVGDLPEVREKEPNNDTTEAQRVELNTTINGAITAPTDVDYFVFAGKKGQRVVLSCLASSIDSRLHPSVELYDGDGRWLGENRDYSANDALVDRTLPADGDYYVRVYQFTYTQGTVEHFYRLSLSTAPWIDAVFPPVVEPGKPATLTVYGRNLPGGKPDPDAVVDGRVLEKVTVTMDVPNEPLACQRLAYTGRVAPPASVLDGFEYRLRNSSGVSNPYLLTYAAAPVVLDNGANDTPQTAQEVGVPCEIAGRIEKRRDRDWYAFSAKKGEVFSLEVFGDRLGSPTDMYFALYNGATRQSLGEFDDNPELLSTQKFFTRTDDPARYRFVVPADGKYLVQASSRDADSRGSPRHLYRLRISQEQPDFRLVVMPPSDKNPSATVVRQGGNQYFDVLAWRRDGWNGSITLSAEGLPPGVTCPPQTLGTGLTRAALVVSAAPDAAAWTGEINVKGTATINGQTLVREARPASITWPLPQQNNNIPAISRLDRGLLLAVRDKAAFRLTAAIDKAAVFQGDKANITMKLNRLWPDLKSPLQVAAIGTPPRDLFLPANLTVNNNQPVTIAPDKEEATAVVDVKPNAAPGIYNIVLRGQAQTTFTSDAPGKQKRNITVALPSTPVTLTVLPRQLARVTLASTNATVKIGGQTEVVIKIARMYDFAGEFKVRLVLPPNAQGISADETTIPAGQDEARIVLRVAADSAPGNRADLLVRATAMFNGSHATTQEVKINVNVVK